MKHCEKCGVDVAGARASCPLCQGALSGDSDDRPETFPYVPTIYKQHGMFLKILILCSVIISVTALAVNLMLPGSGWWSLFIVAGVGCVWISLAVAVRKRRNIPKNMLYQVVVLSALAVLWDLLTNWHGWSLDYVVPFLCIAAMTVLSVIAKVTRLHIEDLMIYFVIVALFGIVPIIFFFTGCLSVIYPSIICVASSVISLGALLVFEGENMLLELKRRLHI
ncbi:DUF6320 domain-containing protein [Candidatus Soleaferrea massiliensis]|uniref:DUF6320 domain-containing protein n=1 Tax=Candidatus Soleaferrea massiliensis TaxID=1470354 RepID=UPI00058E1398|nr:DUF6320 domain-containing protein [Candidatus Soleaferrea massiliensis]